MNHVELAYLWNGPRAWDADPDVRIGSQVFDHERQSFSHGSHQRLQLRTLQYVPERNHGSVSVYPWTKTEYWHQKICKKLKLEIEVRECVLENSRIEMLKLSVEGTGEAGAKLGFKSELKLQLKLELKLDLKW